METKITILCVGNYGKAAQIAEALSRKCESAAEIIIVDSEEDVSRFIPESSLPFHRIEPMPEMDTNIFKTKESEGRRFDGTLKRR